MASLFVGAMLPFLFSALSMNAVGRAAMAMIEEVRRQFKDIPELHAALNVMKENDGKEFEQWSQEDKRRLKLPMEKRSTPSVWPFRRGHRFAK